MAKSATAEAPEAPAVTAGPRKDRKIGAGVATRPAHLARFTGAGRTRQDTEFDEYIPEWYESGEYFPIDAEGETQEELQADLEYIFKALKRAADLYGYGVQRIKEDNPEDPNFEAHRVWVRVQDKQNRGPVPGSIKNPDTGKLVKPGDEGYEELKASRDAAEAEL